MIAIRNPRSKTIEKQPILFHSQKWDHLGIFHTACTTKVISFSEHTVGLRIASSSPLGLLSLFLLALWGASAVRMLFLQHCLQLRSCLCLCCCTKVFLLLLRDPFSDGSNAASKSCAAQGYYYSDGELLQKWRFEGIDHTHSTAVQ